jgi:dihydropyrimidinase
MKLLFTNGTLVTATEQFAADLLVVDGKIQAIGTNLTDDDAKVVDATGKLLLPGALDVHTHLEMPFGGTVSADSYLSGTRAAACGGVTTVFDYPMQRKGKGIVETVHTRDALCAPRPAWTMPFTASLPISTAARCSMNSRRPWHMASPASSAFWSIRRRA